jgi:hypothetical protein
MGSRTGSILAHQVALIKANADLLTEAQAQQQDISSLKVKANDLLQKSHDHDLHLFSQDAKLLDLQADTKILKNQVYSTLAATLAT